MKNRNVVFHHSEAVMASKKSIVNPFQRAANISATEESTQDLVTSYAEDIVLKYKELGISNAVPQQYIYEVIGCQGHIMDIQVNGNQIYQLDKQSDGSMELNPLNQETKDQWGNKYFYPADRKTADCLYYGVKSAFESSSLNIVTGVYESLKKV